jgi:hypothetical protein
MAADDGAPLVLLIDADRWARPDTARFLRLAGYRTLEASDGHSGLHDVLGAPTRNQPDEYQRHEDHRGAERTDPSGTVGSRRDLPGLGRQATSTDAMTPEQRVEWEAEVRSLYHDGMVRIAVTPSWAKLIDFETTLPSAVEELVRQREERQRGRAACGRSQWVDHRTFLDEWAPVRLYRANAERRRVLGGWLHRARGSYRPASSATTGASASATAAPQTM